MNIVEVLLLILLVIIYIRFLAPLIITYKLVDSQAKAPERAYHKAACWDVFATETVPVPANQWREIPIGVAFAPWPHIYIPFLNKTFTPLGNIAAKIHTRSSHGKRGLKVHLGIIDNDYREAWTVLMFNHKSDYPVIFRKGDKVAQIEFYRVPIVKLIRTNNLSKSMRGIKGFGSTGK